MYILFLLLALKITTKVYSFIIPNKLLIADYAQKTLIAMHQMGWKNSVDVSIFNVFKNAGVYPIIILGHKHGDEKYSQYLLEDYSDLLKRQYVEYDEI